MLGGVIGDGIKAVALVALGVVAVAAVGTFGVIVVIPAIVVALMSRGQKQLPEKTDEGA